MNPTLLLSKTAVTTLLFLSLAYGSVHAQSPANTPVPAAGPSDVTVAPVPLADITPQAATTSQNTENAVVLLSRVESIVDGAMDDKSKKKVEKNDGAVMVSRADLDEILAAVGQLKTALQSYGPVQSVTPVTPTK